METLVDVKNAVHLKHEWGDRFTGYYLSKTRLRDEYLPLEYGDAKYNFGVYDYNYRFIMPSTLEFNGGLLSYSDDERHFGIFRFPRNEEGVYNAPVKMDQKKFKDYMDMSPEEAQELLKNKKVLVFEAFRIPQHGFEYFSLEEEDFERISKLTDPEFAQAFKTQYDEGLEQRIAEVKEKISGGPNYLLIILDTLNLQSTNLEETAKITNNIIHLYG